MNPQKIAIITDSCGDIPRTARQKYPIFVIPLTIRCADGEYQDGETISSEEVYRRLATELPKTSLPRGSAFDRALDQIRAQGYRRVIAVMLSSGLSGTFNMMHMKASLTSDLEIRVFDSLSGSLGTGATVLQLARYIEEGVAWEELLRRAEILIANTHVFFSEDSLEYLRKGGRIGRITALAGSMLQIKPILTFHADGQLNTAAKVRGRKAVTPRLVELVEGCLAGHRRYNLVSAHGGAPEEFKGLESALLSAFPHYDHYDTTHLGATLSVYIGPGVLGAGIQILDDLA